jgi:hypothetical protein
VAIGALGLIVVRVPAKLAHPTLVDIMHSMRAAIQRDWSAQMADGAIDDLSRVTLQTGAETLLLACKLGYSACCEPWHPEQ